MSQAMLRQIIDYANRADPYPLYEELRGPRHLPIACDGIRP
ncbi:hypothetical protein [Streptomyces sp. NPDC090036]